MTTNKPRREAATEVRKRIMAKFLSRTAPNWDAWRITKSAPLWEVVAASCNIDPQSIYGWNTANPPYTPPQNFLDRLRLALDSRAQGGDGLCCTHEGTRPEEARVTLQDFRAWAEARSLTLPDGFPQFDWLRPPDESADARRLRLTKWVREERKKGTPNFLEVVANREPSRRQKDHGGPISVNTLKAIIGTIGEQKRRLQEAESN